MNRGERLNLILSIAPRLEAMPWDQYDLVLRTYEMPNSGFRNDDTVSGRLSEGADEDLLELAEYLDIATSPAVPERVQARIWTADGFRLFLTHRDEERILVADVKADLDRMGVCGFVAHENIQPTREWREEIEMALRTSEALAAFLHPTFHESPWTDHEVGFALGRGLLVIPLMFEPDLLPYGLMEKYQGADVRRLDSLKIAGEILTRLALHERTQGALTPHVIGRFERSPGANFGMALMKRLLMLESIAPDLLHRIVSAPETNTKLSDPRIQEGIDALKTKHHYAPPNRTAPDDRYDEEPF